jgi:hypothetical protein
MPHFFSSPVLSIKHNVFNGTIYIFNCDWIRQKLVVRGTIPESTRVSRIHAPSTLPLSPYKRSTLAPSFPSFFGIGASSNQPAGSTSQQSGDAPSSLPSSPFSLGGAVLGMPKMAVGYSGGYTSSASEAECVFGAWMECDEDSSKQEKERVLAGCWKEGSEDMDMRSASSHIGQG